MNSNMTRVLSKDILMKNSIHSYPTFMDYLTRVIFYETCWLDDLPSECGELIISMTHQKRCDPQTRALRELHRSKTESDKCPVVYDCGTTGNWCRGRDLSNHCCPCIRKSFTDLNDPTHPHARHWTTAGATPEGYTGTMRFMDNIWCNCEVHIPDPGCMTVFKLICDTRRDYMTDCFTQLSLVRKHTNSPDHKGQVLNQKSKFVIKFRNTQMFKSLQSNCKDTLSPYHRGEEKCMGFTAKGTPCKCNTVGQNDYDTNGLPTISKMLGELGGEGMEGITDDFDIGVLNIEKKWGEKQIVDMGILGQVPAFHKIYIKRTYNYDDCRTETTDFSGLRKMCGRCSKRYNHSLGPKKTDITREKLLEHHGYGIRNGYIIIK